LFIKKKENGASFKFHFIYEEEKEGKLH